MDQKHHYLDILAVCHYVLAGVSALFACIPIIHVVIGIFLAVSPRMCDSEMPPAFLGWIFISIGMTLMLLGIGLSILLFFTGRFLSTRRNYTFCLVMAAVECLSVPLGTILGVFTIVQLSQMEVKSLFEGHPESRNVNAPHPQT